MSSSNRRVSLHQTPNGRRVESSKRHHLPRRRAPQRQRAGGECCHAGSSRSVPMVVVPPRMPPVCHMQVSAAPDAVLRCPIVGACGKASARRARRGRWIANAA